MASEAYKRAISTFKGRLIPPYQNRGVAWMLSRELSQGSVKGGMMCDEMGLGKTAQTIAMMLGNPVKRTLIVVPKSVLNQWVGEIGRFAPGFSVGIWDSTKPEIANYDVVFTTYGMTMNRHKFDDMTYLHRFEWGRIILDEAHEIRNKKSKAHQSLIRIRSNIRWVLSGTPVFNSMHDFVALGEFIGIPGKYIQADPSNIRKSYIMRRTKADVAEHNSRLALPPCEFENVELDMLPEERDIYVSAYTEARNIILDIFRNSENVAAHSMNILEQLLRIRQTMVHPQVYIDGVSKKGDDEHYDFEHKTAKFEYLERNVRSHPNEKTLIFCQFIREMDLICEMFSDYKVFRLDGSVSMDQRSQYISQFNRYDGKTIFVIQIKAGGVGLNLQSATRVYLTAPSWNPATELQAIGRSHRTGQTQKVYVKKLIYRLDDDTPSVEQSMMELQGSKSKITAEVLNDPRIEKDIPQTNQKGISIRSIRKLFSKSID